MTASAPLSAGVSVVIPVYGDGSALATLVPRLRRCFDDLGLRHEVILVDDCGPCDSWSVIKHLVSHESDVRGFRLMRNSGQQSALLCGIRAATYDTVVTMDDDGQHPPEEIGKLLAQLVNYDLVYGLPIERKHSMTRNLLSVIFRYIMKFVLRVGVAPRISPFRAFRTQLRVASSGYNAGDVSVDVLLSWGTTRMSWISVEHTPRLSGRSTYTLGSLLSLALTMFTGFSTAPLRIATVIGLTFSALGAAGLCYSVYVYIAQGDALPSIPFLSAIFTLFSGVQLLVLGVIGEFLARVHTRSMARPVYVVEEVVEREKAPDPATLPSSVPPT